MSFPGRAYNILRGYVSREWDRIQGVEEDYAELELREQPTRAPTPAPKVEPIEERVHARRILGVAEAAPFREIKRAFDRLAKRSEPDNFPAGSDERRMAADIHKKVHWAYRVLSEGVDLTEKRFQSLELE